jgi:alanyl-tRNA synthetase
VPENDPTTLFTGSGMQPLIPYLLGTPHPEGKRLANSQKSFRAEDIDEVGDNRHTTFFEMLGNWSLGDYWKQDQLSWFFEFLTKEIGLEPENLYVSVFSGGEGIGRDDEAIGIWKKLFADKKIAAEYAEVNTEEEAGERGMNPNERIFGYGVKKNWWSRAGMPSKMPAGEPGGPDSEVFYDFDPSGKTHTGSFGRMCHPNCDCGRFMEIGNSVFMEYKKNEDGSFEKLKQRNVDFGGGLERITAAANGDPDVFKIGVFRNIMEAIEDIFEKSYLGNARDFRIVADHYRAGIFMIADGVFPSNKERGYVLRRLLRRAAYVFYKNKMLKPENQVKILDYIVGEYKDAYPALQERRAEITSILERETTQFYGTLENGLKELKKSLGFEIDPSQFGLPNARLEMPGDIAFMLFATYGLPLDLIKEKSAEYHASVDEKGFWIEFKKHQKLSQTASAGTFKGGLADNSEKTTRLHTAHHLLLKALQMVLGPQVKQRGSNITSERLRMDFSYDGKMTDEQKKEVEKIVNEKIAEDLPVVRSELPREEAEKLGAEHEFGQKYPDRVSVYSVGPKGATAEDPQFDKAFSIEFCGGPHVTHTGEIGKFKILKEEASSAGIRRIRGVVE